jgi:fatty acid/phospholipid biosynthesis enzyme
VTVIGHGRSNARAVFSAIRAARDAVQNGVLENLRQVAKEIPAKKGMAGATEADEE